MSYFNTYFGKERFFRIIDNKEENIKHVSTSSKNEWLVSYGLSRFDLINREGQLIRKFEVDDNEIF